MDKLPQEPVLVPVALTVSDKNNGTVLVGLMEVNMVSALIGDSLSRYENDDFVVIDSIEDSDYVNVVNFILDYSLYRIKHGQVWIKVGSIVGVQELDIK